MLVKEILYLGFQINLHKYYRNALWVSKAECLDYA